MSGFDLQTFRSKIGADGVALTHNYQLSVTKLPGWVGGTSSVADSLAFRCWAAGLPGVSLEVGEVRRSGVGMNEPYPTGVTYRSFTTRVLADDHGKIANFFKTWIGNAVVLPGVQNGQAFRVYPRDNYVSNLQVAQFDLHGNVSATWTLEDAFPVDIGDTPVSWGSTDQVIDFGVTWRYRYWDMTPGSLDGSPEASAKAAAFNKAQGGLATLGNNATRRQYTQTSVQQISLLLGSGAI